MIGDRTGVLKGASIEARRSAAPALRSRFMNPPAAPGSTSRRRELSLLLVVLGVALFLRLGDFREPWSQRGWQHMGATFAIMARNFVEQGYLTTRLAPATNPEPPADGSWDLFLHHPPTFPLLLSASFHALGVHEWSARLVPIVFSLLELLAVFWIARRLFGSVAGLAAAALGATLPATAFYGSHVCELGPVVMAGVALAFVCYLRYLERPGPGRFALLAVTLLFAVTNDWPGAYLAGLLFLHAWYRGHVRAAVGLLVLGVCVISLHLAHVHWATGHALEGGRGGGLVDSFLGRSWTGIGRVGGWSVVLPSLWRHLEHLYTAPVIALAVSGLVLLRGRPERGAFLVFLLAGLMHTLVFGEGAVRHEFWNITMAPSLLVLAGGVFQAIRSRSRNMQVLGLVTLLGCMAIGALRTHRDFQAIQSDYHARLGEVVYNHSRPGDTVTSCEFQADPMAYYARRRFSNRITDELVDSILQARGAATELPPVLFVIPEKKFEPHGHERLLQMLHELAEPTVVETEACGKVYLFDGIRGR